MNVLVYGGDGTSTESLHQVLSCLRAVLSPFYAVSIVSKDQILDEPWPDVTSLLVIPGGADLPYCRDLNGKGNARISRYVRQGGRFMGLCAGAYYGCASIIFEENTPIEVSGPRELAFLQVLARGCVFKGFEYGTNKGARAAKVSTDIGQFTTFYNGGCLFDGDESQMEVLARYSDPIDCAYSGHDLPPAVVRKKFGSGWVVLSGVHLEYDTELLLSRDSYEQELHDDLSKDRDQRLNFLKEVITSIGLQVNENEPSVPHLTPLTLTSFGCKPTTDDFLALFPSEVFPDAENQFFIGSQNTILTKEHSGSTLIRVYPDGVFPSKRETPSFDHRLYYDTLLSSTPPYAQYQPLLGSLFLYGEVVTSTNSILDHNPKFLKRLPHGSVVLGSQQIAGRGRGGNVWVSPKGLLAVSGVIRVPVAECRYSLVFIQYLSSLAMVEAIRSFGRHYQQLGVRLKWPNDIYIANDNSYIKLGGIIVTCSISEGEYILVFGSGTNVDNSHPTVSLNSCIDEYRRKNNVAMDSIKLESLAGRFLAKFNEMFHVFLAQGFRPFEYTYYSLWLHSGQVVTLERYDHIKAVVKGISLEGGMLLAEDLSSKVVYELQPDGNSFNMFSGLLRRKV